MGNHPETTITLCVISVWFPQELYSTEDLTHAGSITEQRLLFAGLSLEFGVAYWPISLVASSGFVDYITFDALYLQLAEVSLALTAVSVVITSLGVFRRGRMGRSNSEVLILLSAFAFLGTLASSWWTVGVASWASMDCGPSTFFKCNLVQAGTYLGYYFFPAIAVPIVTFFAGLANLAKNQRSESEATKTVVATATRYSRFASKDSK